MPEGQPPRLTPVIQEELREHFARCCPGVGRSLVARVEAWKKFWRYLGQNEKAVLLAVSTTALDILADAWAVRSGLVLSGRAEGSQLVRNRAKLDSIDGLIGRAGPTEILTDLGILGQKPEETSQQRRVPLAQISHTVEGVPVTALFLSPPLSAKTAQVLHHLASLEGPLEAKRGLVSSLDTPEAVKRRLVSILEEAGQLQAQWEEMIAAFWEEYPPPNQE